MILQIEGTRLFGALCPSGPEGAASSLGCAVAAWETPILIGLAALAIVALVVWARVRNGRARGGSSDPIPLVFPMSSPSRPALARQRERSSRAPEKATADLPSPPETPSWPPREPTPRKAPEPEPSPEPAIAPPPEGTLQLLPGRLEVISDPPTGTPKEIRFVRVPGYPPEISFGRAPGEAHRHVELPSPTVSRKQALFRFDAGRWTLTNHSTTNPTLLNGTPLDGTGEARPLRDGDTIEMGEITFRFHHPESADRLSLRSSWFTDQGRRPTNQDAVAVRTLRSGAELAVICDGMGIGAGGEIASHRAIDTLIGSLEEGTPLLDATRRANEAVLEALAEAPDAQGAGTTLVALLRTGPRYEVVNVGDSRAYRLDQEGLRQLTEDHSFVAEVVRHGSMTEEEARRTPWKNAVTRHLGAGRELEVDHFEGFDTREPHLVLLCSDGVHAALSDAELEAALRSGSSIRSLARQVVEAALAGGSSDNVTAAVLAFGSRPD